MTSRRFGHRAPLLWIVTPFIAGLALAHIFLFTSSLAWFVGAAMAAAAAVFTARAHPRFWAASLVAALFCAGTGYYALHRQRLDAWDRLPPREARLAVRVDRLFAPNNPERCSGLGTIVGTDPHLLELRGQRIAFAWTLRVGEEPALRSTVVAVIGVIAPVAPYPPANSFDSYLANAGINFRLNRARVVRVEQEPTAYRRFCARALARLGEILNHGVAEKQPELTAVLRAMLLGQKHELNDAQESLFLQSGTMHLFAISGLHIAAIAAGIQASLMLLRAPRWLQFVAGLGALWLYVDITGGAPSAVRAFLMVALWQTAFLWRAPGNALSALSASALVVLVIAPLQIFSASFQMSYAIVAALLLLGLPMAETWRARWSPHRDLPELTWRWWHRWNAGVWHSLSTALALGVASSLVSGVCGVMYFELVTPAGFLANLILIPTAALVISAGFVSLLGGLFGLTVVSGICNHAAVLVLWLIDRLVRAIVQLPGAWAKAQFAADWIGPAALTALLAAMAYGYSHQWQLRRGGYWPPFALLALVLGIAVKFE